MSSLLVRFDRLPAGDTAREHSLSAKCTLPVYTCQLAIYTYDFDVLDWKKIKQLRERLGMSVAEATRRAGLRSRQHWHNIESGRNQNPTLQTLESVAAALGVKAKDLLK
jgi:DNA-binding XRE family transcriptional regulator